MPAKPQIHWSHLASFQRCGEAYRRRYILGEKIAPGIALVIGSGTHIAIEANMRHKKDTGELLKLDAVKACAADAVNAKIEKEGVELTADEKAIGLKNIQGAAVDQTVSLATLHHTDLAPAIHPAHVERPWVVNLEGFPFDLAGKIDLQEIPHDSHSGRVIDTKTAAKSPAANNADNSDQLTMYALAAKVIDGAIPPLRMDSLVKTKTPKTVTQHTTRNDADLGVLMRRIEAHAEAIEKQVYHPASQDSFWCSERFCGYAGSCKFFRKSVSVKVGGVGDE